MVATIAIGLALSGNLVTGLMASWANEHSLLAWTLFGVCAVATVALGVQGALRGRRREQVEREQAWASALDPLPLPPAPAPAGGPRPSRLMSADQAVVPFRGRRKELEMLGQWLTRPGEPFFVLSGPPLVGKTRLSAEFAADHAAGFRAGRLRPGREASAWTAVSAMPGKQLVVIEVGAAGEDVNGFIDDAAVSTKVKTLLVVRNSLRLRFVSQYRPREAIRDALEQASSLELGPHGGGDDLSRWSNEAATAFATELQIPFSGMGVGVRPTAGTPIGVVQAHALANVLADQDSGAVWEELAFHETASWPQFPHTAPSGNGSALPTHCFIAAALRGAATRDEITSAMSGIPDLQGSSAERRGQIADWLIAAYPDPHHPAGWARPLDAIVYAIAIPTLTRSPSLLAGLCAGVGQLNAARAASFVLVAAEQYPDALDLASSILTMNDLNLGPEVVRGMTGLVSSHRLDVLLAEAITQHPPADPEVVRSLLDTLAEHPGLPRSRLALLSRLIRHARTTNDDTALADHLSSSHVELRDLGRWEQALTHDEEALALYRDLAATNPDKHTSDLSLSRQRLRWVLQALGREDDYLRYDPPGFAQSRSSSSQK